MSGFEGKWGQRERSPDVGRFTRDRLVFWLGLGIALSPFVVSLAALAIAGRDFYSFLDRAMVEIDVREVGRHALEVGPYSIGHYWRHPGPAYFYLLAVPYRLLGGRPWGMLAGTLLFNAAAVVGIGILARRRVGTAFALAALAGVLLVLRSLGAAFVRDPWNPFVLVMPLTLLIFVAWSIAEGDRWALPWAAGVASILAQVHVQTVLPVLAVLGTAALMLTGRWSSKRRGTVRAWRSPILVAVGVLALMWLLPVIDAITHDGGNLAELWRYLQDATPKQTLGIGVKAVSNQLTIPPPWIAGDPLKHIVTVGGATPVLPRAPIPWLGLALVAATVFAWIRGARKAARFGVLVAVALAAGAVAISRVTTALAWWYLAFVPALGMLAALATGYAVVSGCTAARQEGTSRAPGRIALAFVAVALVVPSGFLAIDSADPHQVPQNLRSRAVAEIAPATIRAVRDVPGEVLVRSPSDFGALPAIVALLADHGVAAVSRTIDGHEFGRYLPPSRQYRGAKIGAVLTIVRASAASTYARQPSERLVAGRPRRVFQASPATHHLTREQRDKLYERTLSRWEHEGYAVYLWRAPDDPASLAP